MFKLIPLLCTHVYSYMFSTVHPPRDIRNQKKILTWKLREFMNLSTFKRWRKSQSSRSFVIYETSDHEKHIILTTSLLANLFSSGTFSLHRSVSFCTLSGFSVWPFEDLLYILLTKVSQPVATIHAATTKHRHDIDWGNVGIIILVEAAMSNCPSLQAYFQMVLLESCNVAKYKLNNSHVLATFDSIYSE